MAVKKSKVQVVDWPGAGQDCGEGAPSGAVSTEKKEPCGRVPLSPGLVLRVKPVPSARAGPEGGRLIQGVL